MEKFEFLAPEGHVVHVHDNGDGKDLREVIDVYKKKEVSRIGSCTNPTVIGTGFKVVFPTLAAV